MAYSLDGVHLAVQGNHPLVIAVQIDAGSREETGFAAALRAARQVLSVHSVHIGGRRSEIGDIAVKVGHRGKTLYLFEYALFRAGLDKFALMGGYSAEIAASEAPAVGDDRILDHIVGGDAFAFVALVRQLGEWQVPEGIHFIFACRRIRRVDLDIAVPDGLHDGLRVEHIGVGFDLVEVFCEGLSVGKAALVRMEYERVLDLAPAATQEGQLRDAVYLGTVAPCFDGPGQFKHRALPHSVTEVVRSAVHKN